MKLQVERQEDMFLKVNSFISTTSLSRTITTPEMDEFSKISQFTKVLSDVAKNSITLHKRLGSDSIVPRITGRLTHLHKRAPTCPTFTNLGLIFKDIDEESLGSLDTESMTEFIDVESKSILGTDISLHKKCFDLSLMDKGYILDCDEIYASLQRPVDLDVFVEVLRKINQEEPAKFATKIPVFKLTLSAYFPAIFYTVGGLLFTIGSCQSTRLGQETIQNMFLDASSLYLCASSFILWQALNAANEEWHCL